jgi:hypothetical protein
LSIVLAARASRADRDVSTKSGLLQNGNGPAPMPGMNKKP